MDLEARGEDRVDFARDRIGGYFGHWKVVRTPHAPHLTPLTLCR
jgi:hypothetical protein